MNCFYELLSSDKGHLINAFIHSVDANEMHWHDEIEILLVLEGSVNIRMGDKIYLLKEDDLILINNREIHNIIKTKENNVLLEVQIKHEYFTLYYPKFKKMIFECKSFEYGSKNQEHFDTIRRYLAKVVLETYKKEKGYELIIGSNIHLLCAHIISNFRHELADDKKVEDFNRDTTRLQSIIDYINNNYEQKITLKDIADREQISIYYLSHFFKDKMGMSFQQYMNSVRIDKATRLLLNTNDTVTNISYASGFSSTKSFYKLFKDTNSCTPTAYRKKYRNQHGSVAGTRCGQYGEINKEKAFAKLFTYLHAEDIKLQDKFMKAKKEGTPYTPYRKNPTAFNTIPDGLKGGWASLFQGMQGEIGFTHVKFQGIFSDAMMLRSLDGKGNVIYNWSNADEVFMFLRNANLKPYIDLGYMPSEFKVFDKTMFWWDSEISGPNDICLWADLVKDFINHCINKHGLEEVESWYFGVWNEEDYDNAIWIDGREEYNSFYKKTVQIIKSVSKNLQIGDSRATDTTFQVIRGFKI